MPLVLTGNLKLGVDSGSAVEHGDEVTSFAIGAKVDEVEVPQTMSVPAHSRGGAVDYSVTIAYLSNDLADALFRVLWTTLTSSTKTLYFEGTLRGGSVTAANPKWSGTFVVTEASVGAAAEALSTGSATFPLTGAPSQATS